VNADGGNQELIVGSGEALVLINREDMSAGHDVTIAEVGFDSQTSVTYSHTFFHAEQNTVSIRVPFSTFPEYDVVKLSKCFKFNKKVGGKHIWSEKKL
jgi:hypothetical protein